MRRRYVFKVHLQRQRSSYIAGLYSDYYCTISVQANDLDNATEIVEDILTCNVQHIKQLTPLLIQEKL